MNNAPRVSFASREHYRLLLPDGNEGVATLSGTFRRSSSRLPVVGDYVELDGTLIREVLPRRSQFSRRAAGTKPDEQVLAANIDVVFIVCGLDGDFNQRRIDRYLVLAEESGAVPVVVLNKADLLNGQEPPRVECDAPVVCTSTEREDGLLPLEAWLRPGVTVALLGSSGAGKSSITNRLLQSEELRTQPVREHDSRGRHTTTHRELFQLPGGAFLIDTPGMRELQLWAEQDSVDDAFTKVRELAQACRFSDCRHNGEPGCAVEAAIAAGELDYDRLASYRKLSNEVRGMDKNAVKKIHKQMRQHYKHNSK
ncbi:MAG TPA: ribosome small subunit-dependent GTPase A [Bryobacteraceae bacterium]|nr:ribosome small subunit-dependent GTPase A [Bryobacteraceae bacterium]